MCGHPVIILHCLSSVHDAGGSNMFCRAVAHHPRENQYKVIAGAYTTHHAEHPAAIVHWLLTGTTRVSTCCSMCAITCTGAPGHSARAARSAHLARLGHVGHLAHAEHMGHLAVENLTPCSSRVPTSTHEARKTCCFAQILFVGPFGRIWKPSRRSWGRLGTILDRPETVLEPSWGPAGRSWGTKRLRGVPN